MLQVLGRTIRRFCRNCLLVLNVLPVLLENSGLAMLLWQENEPIIFLDNHLRLPLCLFLVNRDVVEDLGKHVISQLMRRHQRRLVPRLLLIKDVVKFSLVLGAEHFGLFGVSSQQLEFLPTSAVRGMSSAEWVDVAVLVPRPNVRTILLWMKQVA